MHQKKRMAGCEHKLSSDNPGGKTVLIIYLSMPFNNAATCGCIASADAILFREGNDGCCIFLFLQEDK